MNKLQREQIKSLLKDPRWEAVLKASADKIDQWLGQNVIGDTSYETLKLTFEKEFKVQGLKEFLNFLEEEALQ